eukprot:1921430-Rhodomonas_salina.1
MDLPNTTKQDSSSNASTTYQCTDAHVLIAAHTDSKISSCLNAETSAALGEKKEQLLRIGVGSAEDYPQGQCNHFWNQAMDFNTPRGCSPQTFPDFASPAWKHTFPRHVPLAYPVHQPPTPAPSLWASTKIEVENTMWTREAAARSGKRQARCRKNKKALCWTTEDHKKFMAGLEQFGLERGLGPGGAELMS